MERIALMHMQAEGKSRAFGGTSSAGGERVRETVASSCNGNGSGYMSESEK